MSVSRAALLGAIALGSFAAVGAALVSQHVFEMLPCPWCVLQRLVFVAIGVVALVGLAARSPTARRALPLVLLVLCGIGIAAALWQHVVAAQNLSCNLTLADRVLAATGLPALLPGVFEPRATCADAAVDLAGVPYELWSLALFAAIAAGALWLFARERSTVG